MDWTAKQWAESSVKPRGAADVQDSGTDLWGPAFSSLLLRIYFVFDPLFWTGTGERKNAHIAHQSSLLTIRINRIVSVTNEALFSATALLFVFRLVRIYFCIIKIPSSLAQLSSYFCALSQATINVIIPGTEMRQNVNWTVITASHQLWHVSSSMGKQSVIPQTAHCVTLLLRPCAQPAKCALDRENTLIHT